MGMKLGIAIFLGAILAVFAFASHRRAESEQIHQEIEAAKLTVERLAELARREVSKVIPDAECRVNFSGGVSYDELTMGPTIFFDQHSPVHPIEVVDQLEEVVDELSKRREVVEWLEGAEGTNTGRFCKFAVDPYDGRPVVQMLVHVSDLPNGIRDSRMRGFWDKHQALNWK